MIKELADKLYAKLLAEYLNYISEIKLLSKDEIIKNAYQITIKREFVDMFYGTCNFNKFQLLALLEKEKPLQFLYDSWDKSDGGIHNILEEKLDDDFYELGNNYKNKVMLEIQKDGNYQLIENISDTLSALDDYDFCTYIKEKFKVDDLDEYDIHLVLYSKDGAKYLYDFCDEIKNEQQVKYLRQISVLDNEKMDNIEDKILPNLRNVIKEQDKVIDKKSKEKERDER